jgi:hypothetical protein
MAKGIGPNEGKRMYIGIGTVVLILLIILVVMALRGRRI